MLIISSFIQVLFVQIDMANDDSERVSSFFNIEDNDTPTIRIINLEEDMKKFVPEFKGLDADKIKDWVNTYISGELKVQSRIGLGRDKIEILSLSLSLFLPLSPQAHLNTEDIPEDWNEKPVKVLVGKNFEEVALDQSKNVFVEFCKPWLAETAAPNKR